MRRVIGFVSAAIAVLAVALSAQGTDFSGKWTLDPNKNPKLRCADCALMTIVMDSQTMKVTASLGPAGETVSIYKLDGSDSKNTVRVPAPTGERGGPGFQNVKQFDRYDQTSIARWEGAALIITTKTANGDRTAKYSIDGADLKVETSGPVDHTQPPLPGVVEYKKKS